MEIYNKPANHDYLPSEKMFKDKFRDWQAFKYKPKSGNKSSYKVVKSHMKKVSKQKQLQSTDAAVVTITRTLESDKALRWSQNILVALFRYFDNRLFVNGVDIYFGQIDSSCSNTPTNLTPYTNYSTHLHPAELNQSVTRGITLLAVQSSAGMTMFRRAEDVLDSLFHDHHPTLTACLLDAFVGLLCSQTREVQHVSLLACEKSILYHGQNHPITLLCKILYQLTKGICTLDHIFHFWSQYCKQFYDKLGLDHPISLYLNIKLFEKLEACHYYQDALQFMQSTLDPVFASVVTSGVALANNLPASLCYLRRRASLYRSLLDLSASAQNLQLSITIILHSLPFHPQTLRSSPFGEEIFRTMDETSQLFTSLSKPVLSNSLSSAAIQLCILIRGSQDSKTWRMVHDRHQFLTQYGHHVEAAALKMQYPTYFTSIQLDDTPPAHILPCPNCGNGPVTSKFCTEHRIDPNPMSIGMEEQTLRAGLVALLTELVVELGNEA